MAGKIRILYVDNNAGDRALVRDSLEKEHGGFSLELAKSKEEFEKLIHSQTFDLVLTDFNILGFEGLQVLKTVQTVSPDTPVVIVTGTGSEEVAVKALKMGAADYIIKTTQHILRLPNTINGILEKNRLLKEREIDRRKLMKMNRVYALISQINQLIVREHDSEVLLQKACDIAIEYGKFQMAWIGLLKADDDFMIPHCWAGHEDGYLSEVDINQDPGTANGLGPARMAFNEGKYYVCNDIEHNPIFTPWRKEALKRGYHSSISLPLKKENKTVGTFNVYSGEPDFFDEQEINSFLEIVGDLSFALDAIQTEEIRRKNERELQTYFEHDISADFLVTADGKLINCNKTFYKMFAIESEVQKERFNITDLYRNPEERKKLIDEVKEKGKVDAYEIDLVKEDGTPLYVLGNILGNFNESGELVSLREYAVDITKRKIAEKELMKINRLFALISQVNQMIVRTSNTETLFQESCNIAITFGKFRMAWIGLLDENSETVHPHCWAGHEEGYFKATPIKRIDSVPEGRGPSGRAFREGKYAVCNDIEHDPVFEPWRKEALKRNYRSSITLPIMTGKKVAGIYNIYADEPHFFDAEEIKLLEEVVGDISFALEGIMAEENRRKNEKELQAYFEHDISADFLVTADGKLINCNKTFYKMFAIESEAQKERFNITDLYRNPEERKKLIDEVKEKGEVDAYEIDLVKKDGTPLYVLGNILGNFNESGELVSLREYTVDITKRKMAEELSLKLSRAVEQSPETIIITDKDGTIEYVNPTFTKVTGYTFEEVRGENPRILSSKEKSQKEYKEMWDIILSGKVWRGEFHDKKKNGELYWEQASISPIFNEKGEITHFVAVKEDITERKAKDLRLNMALEKAQESDRLKSAFLANMSHEIRTPMNGILGFAELLKEPMVSGEQQEEYLGIIEKSANRMLNIITDIVNISKIEAGQMDVYISQSNLNKEMDFLYSFFKPETDKKKIKLTFQKGMSDDEAIIKTDLEKLSSILTNLIKNAIKFTSEGSIEVGYEKKKGNYLEFFVRDTGIGISEQTKKIVFERFRQGTESITRNYEGSGLGMAISKAYVEMLGGKIWFKSKYDGVSEEHGTEFRFTVPYHSASKKSAKAKKATTTRGKDKKGRKYNILIVEDDEVSEMLLKYILEPVSKKMYHAPTGQKAIEIVKENPDIDFILMDIRMPVMSGYDATKQIRKFNKEVLIIAQTAFAMEGDREKAIKAGCNDYITKPIELNKFRVILKKFNLE